MFYYACKPVECNMIRTLELSFTCDSFIHAFASNNLHNASLKVKHKFLDLTCKSFPAGGRMLPRTLRFALIAFFPLQKREEDIRVTVLFTNVSMTNVCTHDLMY